jgi:hypothetical protein
MNPTIDIISVGKLLYVKVTGKLTMKAYEAFAPLAYDLFAECRHQNRKSRRLAQNFGETNDDQKSSACTWFPAVSCAWLFGED